MIAVKITSNIIITPPSIYLSIKGKVEKFDSAFKFFRNYSPKVIDCLESFTNGLFNGIIQL